MDQEPIHDDTGETTKDREAQIQAIKQRLEDLRGRWPRHSVPPAMLQELEELEDQLWELEHGE